MQYLNYVERGSKGTIEFSDDWTPKAMFNYFVDHCALELGDQFDYKIEEDCKYPKNLHVVDDNSDENIDIWEYQKTNDWDEEDDEEGDGDYYYGEYDEREY